MTAPLNLAAIEARLQMVNATRLRQGELQVLADLTELLAALRATRAALMRWGRHSDGCKAKFSGQGEWFTRADCTCGVYAVLTRVTEGPS